MKKKKQFSVTHGVVLKLLKNLNLHHLRSNAQSDSANLVPSVAGQWPWSCCRSETTIGAKNEEYIQYSWKYGEKTIRRSHTVQSPPLVTAT